MILGPMSTQQPSFWESQEALARRLDEALREVQSLRAELDHAHRLATLGTIAGSIAHEFNNILTPVLSYAELALGKPGDEALTHKALERAADGADRASKIASAILGLVERRDGRPLSANLRECVEQALLCLARPLVKDGIEVVIEVPSTLSAGIDPVALQHVLLNLVLNARRALRADGGSGGVGEGPPEPGSRRLVIAAGARVEARCSTWNIPRARADEAGIVVVDNGCGMDAATRDRVARPFERGALGEPGVGLGLAISRRLVEAVGGRLGLDSRPGAGTCVGVTLPIADALAKAA